MFETIVVMFLFLAVVFLLFSNLSKSRKLRYLEDVFYDTTGRLSKSITKVDEDMHSKMKAIKASPSEETTANEDEEQEDVDAEPFESEESIEVAFMDGSKYEDDTKLDWFKAVFVQCSSVNGKTHVWLRMGNEPAQSFPLSKVVLAKSEEKKPS